MKDCLTSEEENPVSMLVKLYDEEYVRKVTYDLAFQNSFLVDKYYQNEKQAKQNTDVVHIHHNPKVMLKTEPS